MVMCLLLEENIKIVLLSFGGTNKLYDLHIPDLRTIFSFVLDYATKLKSSFIHEQLNSHLNELHGLDKVYLAQPHLSPP